MYFHDWEKDSSGFLILLIVPVMVLLGSVLTFQKTIVVQATDGVVPIQIAVPAPTVNPWKTYQNNKYGFEITYPASGVVLGEGNYSLGKCGTKIMDVDNKTILFDNFFEIKIIDWSKSISDYMKQQGAGNIYNTKVVDNFGADEGIVLEGLKPKVEYARGFPPLAYTLSIYKKGSKLFILQSVQNPKNIGGCMNPSIVNPIDYPEVASQKWNMATSLKFSK